MFFGNRKKSEDGPSESQELQLSTNENVHGKVAKKEMIQAGTTFRIDSWKLGNHYMYLNTNQMESDCGCVEYIICHLGI